MPGGHRVREMAVTIGSEASTGGSPVLAGLLMSAGVLIITVVLVLRVWRVRRRDARRSQVPIAERAGIGVGSASGRSEIDRMEAVMVEMQELTRICAAQVENRVARLEMAIREADERLARLSAAQGRSAMPGSSGVPAQAQELVATRPTPVVRPIIGADELSQRVYALADTGMAAGDVARELGEHTGKVELILALRQESRRAAAGAGA